MSEENVERFKLAVDAYNRQDADALLEFMDNKVEWHPAILVGLGGKEAVFRGHEGIRELLREIDETLAEIHVEVSEIRDLGDRIFAIGRLRTRGKASGVETEAPFGYIAHFKNEKATEIRTYLDPKEALEAAGLSE
jgi:ketosteroid isomerase-like protein